MTPQTKNTEASPLESTASLKLLHVDPNVVLGALGAALYTTDARGRLTFFNEAAAELWGRRPALGEESWRGPWRIFWPNGDPVPLEKCPMALSLKENRPIRDAETVIERPDGSRVNVHSYPSPIHDSAGKLVGAIDVLLDISQYKRVEEDLRASEERLTQELTATQYLQEASLQLISDDSLDVIYENLLDTASAIMHSDMSSMQLMDEGLNALRLLTWRGFDPSFGTIFAVNGRDSQTCCAAALRLGKRTIVPDIETCEFIDDASALNDHVRFGIRAVQSTPLTSRSGKLLGMISTHWRQPYRPPETDLQRLDVLARQAADLIEHSQAVEAANRLAAVVESSGDAIVSKDLNGIIKTWNRAAELMFGYSEAEAVGQSIRLIIPPDRQYEEDEVLSRISKGQRVEHFETVRRRKDGSELDVSLTVSPVKDASGRVMGASKVARDISERRAAETAVRRSMDLKDQFLGLVSHELKGPLTTIVGNGLLLKKLSGRLSASESQQALDDLLREADRLDKTIDNLLLLTRLESGSKLDVEPVHLSRSVASALESLRHRHPERDVSLETVGDVPLVYAQPDYLSEVLENLLENAHKYSPVASRIEIVITSVPEGASVKVLDRGIGISNGHVEQLFKAFYRTDEARKMTAGLGLGLALSKRILEALGGTIKASPRPGGGAEFSFILPGVAD